MKELFVRAIVLAVVGGVSLASLVYAQDARPAPQEPARPEHGMMSGDMSGMMARMSKMMDACEKMMQSKQEEPKSRAQ